ncbi:hypothetical protein GWK16_17040 [Roseomonas sp. JC162]|uniref:Anti-sigma factor NepR domain-containing protein n=1 Tax=Neoroseomonas marina TaxID=1232220 RepID=A0A848EG36_9PROT|nr:hypothetical protein [Neoroseomonas marina]NMJ42956.1 hypothetical protein [Neoroseomonas marina]
MIADQKLPAPTAPPPREDERPSGELEAAIRRIYTNAAAEPLPSHLVDLVKRLAAKGE